MRAAWSWRSAHTRRRRALRAGTSGGRIAQGLGWRDKGPARGWYLDCPSEVRLGVGDSRVSLGVRWGDTGTARCGVGGYVLHHEAREEHEG